MSELDHLLSPLSRSSGRGTSTGTADDEEKLIYHVPRVAVPGITRDTVLTRHRGERPTLSQLLILLFMLVILTALLLILSHWAPLPSQSVVSPVSDTREYRAIVLPNGLSVLLISDPTSDMSSAAMSVNTGNWYDPEDIPGLAHFTEHMLFMGSERYPGESDYLTYILSHGGDANGYTLTEETNLHFKIESMYLVGGLDRFASVFTSPLLWAVRMEREMKAINSEYEKNLLLDERRSYQVLADQSAKTSPLHHFGTGNLHTLNRSDIHRRLVSFYLHHYSANRMKLVVLGRSTLNQLQYNVMHLFSAVPNHHLHSRIFHHPPFIHGVNLPSLTYLQPVSASSHVVDLYWPLQSLALDSEHRVGDYLCYLLSHEGEGSLVWLWRQQGVLQFANATLTIDSPSISILQYQLTLSLDALSSDSFDSTSAASPASLPSLLHALISSVFAYLSLVANESNRQDRWEEWRRLQSVTWDWQDKQDVWDYTTALAKRMQHTDVQYVLDPPARLQYDGQRLTDVLAQINTDDVLVHIASPFTPHKYYELMEPYYHVPYSNHSIPPHILQQWQTYTALSPTSAHPISLPANNPFIPTDFQLVEAEPEELDHPSILFTNAYLRLYYNQALSAHLPLSFYYITFYAGLIDTSAADRAMLTMIVLMLNEALAPTLFQAKLAGYNAVIQAIPTGLHIQLSGISCTFPLFLHTLFAHLRHLAPHTLPFIALRDSFIHSLLNYDQQQPYYQALYLSTLYMEQTKIPNEEFAALIATLSVDDDYHRFLSMFFTECYIEAFGYGNVRQETVWNYTDIIMQYVDTYKPIHLQGLWRHKHSNSSSAGGSSSSNHIRHHNFTAIATNTTTTSDEVDVITLPTHFMLFVPPGSNYLLRHRVLDNLNHNHAVAIHYYMCDDNDLQQSTMLDLLALLINQPLFNQLRTKEQLGYIVHTSAPTRYNALRTLTLVLQSSTYTANYLTERILYFLHHVFVYQLMNISHTEWERSRNVLLIEKRAEFDSMTERSGEQWVQILNHEQWYRKEQELQYTARIQHAAFMQMYSERVLQRETRRRMIVEVYGEGSVIARHGDDLKRGDVLLPSHAAARDQWKKQQPVDRSAVVMFTVD